jgi:predicted permease
VSARLVRVWAKILVWLYPPGFRESVGLDLSRLLVDGAGDAGRRPGGLWVFMAWNTVLSIRDAVLEWIESARRISRAKRGGRMNMARTVRHAARALLRRPRYSIPALLTLTLGIGATTAVFSVLQGVILRPLPYGNPKQIVEVFPADIERGNRFASFSLPDVRDWAVRTRSLEALGAYTTLPSDRIMTGGGDAIELETAYVTAGFFESLGVQPELGRYFTDDEHFSDNRVVVASHAFWMRGLGGAADVVGRTLTLNGDAYVLTGVMPPTFDFPSMDVEVWVPLSVIPASSTPFEIRELRLLNGIGRLSEGVDAARAQAELSSIARALSREYPDSNERITSATIRSLHEGMVGDVRPALLVLTGAAGLVLLLVCANLANLALAREAHRGPDLAVRAALGASRSHRMGVVIAESLLLALAGAASGLALAVWGTDLLLSRSSGAIPRAHAVDMDWQLAVFALAVAVATGVLFSILPALRAGRANLAERLSRAGRGSVSPRIKGGLVVSQVAFSVVLLVGAALLVRSLWSLSRTDPGFDAENLVVADITFPTSRYPERPEYLQRYTETLDALAAIPGVSAVGTIRRFPFRGSGEGIRWTVPGVTPDGAEGTSADFLQVSPGLFNAMGIDFVEGADFEPNAGRDGRSLAIVSETLARQAFGGEPAIGRMLSIGNENVLEVVGVVRDVRQTALDRAGAGMMYVPQFWSPRRGAAFVLRADRDPAGVIAAVRDVVRAQDANQPITLLSMATEIVGGQIARPRFFTLLLAVFAALSMTLSAVGVYGVVAAGVAQRRREIGIRMAIGANRLDVGALIVREGMAPVAIGLVVGVIGAFASTRLLESLLFQVRVSDPLTYVVALGLLAIVGALACYLPARSASGTDPVRALAPE